MNRIIVFFMVATFTFLGVVCNSPSCQDTKGFVTKIEGGELYIQDSTSQLVTISSHDPIRLEGFKVGDRVVVKDGKIMKEISLKNLKTFPM